MGPENEVGLTLPDSSIAARFPRACGRELDCANYACAAFRSYSKAKKNYLFIYSTVLQLINKDQNSERILELLRCCSTLRSLTRMLVLRTSSEWRSAWLVFHVSQKWPGGVSVIYWARKVLDPWCWEWISSGEVMMAITRASLLTSTCNFLLWSSRNPQPESTTSLTAQNDSRVLQQFNL